uniref:UDENN domain-containing protein n=1 Tax=Denticeps clupeoides TaxID=299321 RepID=A0AAY4BRK9_9TELE
RCSQLSDTEESCLASQGRFVKAEAKLLSQRNWSQKTASLRSGASLCTEFPEPQSRLAKSRSIACLDKRLSIYKSASAKVDPEQKENQHVQESDSAKESPNPGAFSWSTLSLGPGSSSTNPGHKRTYSLSSTGSGVPPTIIRKKITEWECRQVAPSSRMSLCLEKRQICERLGGSEGCSSLLPSPCSDKTFDFKGVRRMSTAFSECSYPETEEDEVVSDRDVVGRFRKRSGKGEVSGVFTRCQSARKETSAVLNRIQKIEQSLKENPSQTPPQYLNNCYGLDKTRQKTFTIGGLEDFDSTCGSKRSSICSVATEPDATQAAGRAPVNPLPKPKRTFEYDVNRSHKGTSASNGLHNEPPPPLPSTPAPSLMHNLKTDRSSIRKSESGESEDAASLPSSYPSSPTENGTASTGTPSRPSSKSPLEENAYEDIMGMISGSPQLPSKPSSQSLRLPGPADRKRASRLAKRHSHDEMMLMPQLSTSPCGQLDDSLSTASDTLASRRHRMVPKVVQRINTIYSSKRGKKRLKKLSLSNIETSSLRDDNSESESDSDDRFKAHTQRLLKLQSMLRRAPSYRTLELQLLEWQERELFEYFVVVSLKKKPTKNSYTPEVTYQFPKLERPTKQMREAEQRLKAIPQFCFPDAKDWSPVTEFISETFSFMLTGEDGSRRFGYCRRLLPSGKGPRVPEVYCVISRLGCFDLFSKILDEVERRRGISAALVYPFMRSLMESPFPAPGKTIKVKTFLPGEGNDVIELRRPMDSRLEHVDFECLFKCLSVRQVIRVFASLLLERRVIFVADKLSTLSSCAHAVVALLYPFSWQHTFIPVLPASMVDIVCCPTPFLVGLLSSSVPKLKELPVEEALMVDLGSDRFIRQMDDEASLLPRKLQAALEQALEQRNDIINQDSDSESDEECNTLNNLVSEAFIRFFLESIGHYSLFMTQGEKGERLFQREAFRKSVASKSIRRFLGVFMESQMFAGFIQDRELRKCRAKGLFEKRVEQYLEELPDTEQSGVNRFLKGFLKGSKKLLHKKS